MDWSGDIQNFVSNIRAGENFVCKLIVRAEAVNT